MLTWACFQPKIYTPYYDCTLHVVLSLAILVVMKTHSYIQYTQKNFCQTTNAMDLSSVYARTLWYWNLSYVNRRSRGASWLWGTLQWKSARALKVAGSARDAVRLRSNDYDCHNLQSLLSTVNPPESSRTYVARKMVVCELYYYLTIREMRLSETFNETHFTCCHIVVRLSIYFVTSMWQPVKFVSVKVSQCNELSETSSTSAYIHIICTHL